MDNSQKLLISRINDLFSQCKRQSEAKFSAFLDGGEQAEIEDNVYFPSEFNTMFYGGFDGAERKILGVFPEWEDAKDFPISVLKITSRHLENLSHRDFLGALMSQGVDRNKTGDILIAKDAAYAFVCADIAQYFANNITKIGNTGVKIAVCDTVSITVPTPETTEYGAVCASCRLDAVLGAMCKTSRGASAKLISGGAVKVNHRVTENVSQTVNPDDLISVRGYGRFILSSVDGKTAKGRVHITVKKF